MAIQAADIKRRFTLLALRAVKMAATFPRIPVGDVVGRQLIRSSTGAAANYRAACRARSHADFANKLGIVEEEADETLFWIEFAVEAGLVKLQLVAGIATEGEELLAIAVASRKTAKARPKKAAT